MAFLKVGHGQPLRRAGSEDLQARFRSRYPCCGHSLRYPICTASNQAHPNRQYPRLASSRVERRLGLGSAQGALGPKENGCFLESLVRRGYLKTGGSLATFGSANISPPITSLYSPNVVKWGKPFAGRRRGKCPTSNLCAQSNTARRRRPRAIWGPRPHINSLLTMTADGNTRPCDEE